VTLLSAPSTASTDTTAPHDRARLRLVPDGVEARGFALYVGLDEAKAHAAGTDLATVVAALRRLAAELVPDVETYAAVALAPQGAGGRDVDIVRRALSDRATADGASAAKATPRRATGVVIDLTRKRVLLDDETAPLTYREFELLRFLVLREGRTVARTELIDTLWAGADDAPNERTIDVHIRRLRAKLGSYDEVVRTVRGSGYRFDRHADVKIRYGQGPSPDRI
jgi:DNA-binding response OmpR family regulator